MSDFNLNQFAKVQKMKRESILKIAVFIVPLITLATNGVPLSDTAHKTNGGISPVA